MRAIGRVAGGRIHDVFAQAVTPIAGQTRGVQAVGSAEVLGKASKELAKTLVDNEILPENSFNIVVSDFNMTLEHTPKDLYNKKGMQNLIDDSEVTPKTKEILYNLLDPHTRLVPIDAKDPYIRPKNGMPDPTDLNYASAAASKGSAFVATLAEGVTAEEQKTQLEGAIAKHKVFKGKDVVAIEVEGKGATVGFSIHEKTHYSAQAQNAYLDKKQEVDVKSAAAAVKPPSKTRAGAAKKPSKTRAEAAEESRVVAWNPCF